MLSWVVPALVFFGIWYLLARRMSQAGGLGGGFMSIGKSRAKIYVENKTGVTFKDVAGVEEAKTELQEVVEFLKDPKKYGRLGARVPKGVLLVGPPGTGKTLLAKAVAGEATVPFFSISGSEFVELFDGMGAARMRDLFEQAKQKAPCIVFIDEIDAIGKARSSGRGMFFGHDEREQTLNQLLVEMDGFDSSKGVIIIAATNTPEVLDPALLRAGRFDRQVIVDRPDLKGREDILRVHARKIKLADAVDLHVIAARTPGMVGADLANIVNEAALLAARRGAAAVEMRDLEEAIDRVTLGLEKRTRVMTPAEKERVAYHETGHALTALSVKHAQVFGKPMMGQYLESTMSFGEQRNFSEHTAERIDEEVAQLIERIYQRVKDILSHRRGVLERITVELQKRETIDREELEKIVSETESPPRPAAA